MNEDVVFLPDAIEAPDSLFDQFRVQGQIEQDQVAAKLKVSALAANLGTNQEPRPIVIRKPSGIAVALNQ